MATKRKAVEIKTESEHKVSDEPVQKIRKECVSDFCEFSGCKAKSRSYNYKKMAGKYCSKHKQPGMVNVYKVCDFGDCDKQCQDFGFEDQLTRVCSTHKIEGMLYYGRKCDYPGCLVKSRQYRFKDQPKKFCLSHFQDGMVYCGDKRCDQEGCEVKCINYGFEGQNQRYCEKHKTADMTYLGTTCMYPLCKSPSRSFNFKGLPGQFCSQHRSKGMVNLSETCKFGDCTNGRYWGPLNSFKQFCKEHKSDTMVFYPKNKPFCRFPGCNTTASFKTKNGTRPTTCSFHKTLDMIPSAKPCLFEGCIITCLKFGNHVTGRVYCAKHADRTIHWKLTTCKQARCKQIATHSETGAFPFKFCESHSPDGFSSCKEQRCLGCNLPYLCDEEGYCLFSCTRLYKERMKLTENALNDFLEKKGLTFTRDTSPGFTCTAKRPDFEFRTPFGVVLVENDEDQHKSRVCECEQRRMMELHQSYGEAVHFIRFNPDRFVQSVSGKRGFVDLTVRHKELFKILQGLLKRPDLFFKEHPGLSMRYMYYDNCDEIEHFNDVKALVY